MANEAFNRNTLFNADGLVAVITGGGSGIGLTFARTLATNGAKAVYIIGRRVEVVEDAASSHENIHALRGDITSKDSLMECADLVKAREGAIDVLVANAGVDPPQASAGLGTGGRPGSVKEFADAMWKVPTDLFDLPLRTNVTGTFYTALAFLPLLDARVKQREEQLARAREKGDSAFKPIPSPQILLTSSIAGHSRIVTGHFAYSASKAGVTHLGKQLATYLAPWHIRVNVFAPGLIATEMTANRGGVEKTIEGAVAGDVIPLQRWGSDDDIAGVGLFILSPAGAYLNGSVLLFDGGRLSVAPSAY